MSRLLLLLTLLFSLSGLAMGAHSDSEHPSFAARNTPTQNPRVNRMEPVQDASGPHTSFKRNQQGRVTGYETYDVNPNTGRFGAERRFRGEGGPHGGVEPPFILERAPGKGPGARPVVPRPARPEELPRGY